MKKIYSFSSSKAPKTHAAVLSAIDDIEVSPTPFEKFEQMVKTVVRVPKKEIIASAKKLVAKKERKRAAYHKAKKKKKPKK